MAQQTFRTEGSGEQLRLKTSLGVGAEGQVWAIEKPGYVAKIYHPSAYPDSAKLSKLRFMVGNQLTLAQPNGPINIAWPAELVSDGKRVVGFLMPSFPNSFKLFDLLSANGRLKVAPELGFSSLLFLARNVAAAFEEVHRCGHIVGDVNPYNVLARRDGSVCLIDTDSFGLRDRNTNVIYHKPMAQWEYQAPECHQGKVPSNSIDPHRDRFSLAVLVFYLLFGRHPTAGRWVGRPPTPEQSEKIREGHLLLARGAKVQVPPQMPDPAVLSPQVRQLFERAFVCRQPEVCHRPSAGEWRLGLETALLTLTQCGSSAMHQFDVGWNFHRGCPWCGLAANKLNYFPSRPGPGPNPAAHFTAQIERAVQSENERAVQALWLNDRRDALLAAPARKELEPRANELNQLAIALESFIEALRTRPDDARHLADRWDARLDRSETARTITFRGWSITEIAQRAKAGSVLPYNASPVPPRTQSPAAPPPVSSKIVVPAPRRPIGPHPPKASRPSPSAPPVQTASSRTLFPYPARSLLQRFDERTKRVLDWFLGI